MTDWDGEWRYVIVPVDGWDKDGQPFPSSAPHHASDCMKRLKQLSWRVQILTQWSDGSKELQGC